MQRAFIFSSVVLLAADIVCVLGATSDANSSFASLHKDRRSDEDLNSSSFSADETSKINPTAGNTSSAALVSIKLSYADSAEAESAADGIQAAFTLNQEPVCMADNCLVTITFTNSHPDLLTFSATSIELPASGPEWCCGGCDDLNATSIKRMCAAWMKPKVVHLTATAPDIELFLATDKVGSSDGDTDVVLGGMVAASYDDLFDGTTMPKITVKARQEEGQMYPSGTAFIWSLKGRWNPAQEVFQAKHLCCADLPEKLNDDASNSRLVVMLNASTRPDDHLDCKSHCGEGCWGVNFNKKNKACRLYYAPVPGLRLQSAATCRCYVKDFDGMSSQSGFDNPPQSLRSTTEAATPEVTATVQPQSDQPSFWTPPPPTTNALYGSVPTPVGAEVSIDLPKLEETTAATATTEKKTARKPTTTTTQTTTGDSSLQSILKDRKEAKVVGTTAALLFALTLFLFTVVMYYRSYHNASKYDTLSELGPSLDETSFNIRGNMAGIRENLYNPCEALTDYNFIHRRPVNMRRINRGDINLLYNIQKGSFGQIMKAQLCSANEPSYIVAVKRKSPKNKLTNTDEDFLAEGLLMAEFKCKFVLGFIGVSTDSDLHETWLVLEYCEFGSLFSQLRPTTFREEGRERSGSDCRQVFATIDGQLQAALEIATGMAYLESKTCVHRDLATRNVLVSSSLECKIADFGLSRSMQSFDMPDERYYVSLRGMMALRWSAPESISRLHFSSASDVWGFGVVMIELFTKAAMPYKGVGDRKLMVQICDTAQNFRLEKPATMSAEIYAKLVSPCWEHDPKARPTFSVLKEKLEGLTGCKPSGDANHYTTCSQVVERTDAAAFLEDGCSEVSTMTTSSTIWGTNDDVHKGCKSVLQDGSAYIQAKKEEDHPTSYSDDASTVCTAADTEKTQDDPATAAGLPLDPMSSSSTSPAPTTEPRKPVTDGSQASTSPTDA